MTESQWGFDFLHSFEKIGSCQLKSVGNHWHRICANAEIQHSLFYSTPLTPHCQCSFRLLTSLGEGLQITCSVSTGVNWCYFPNSTCCTGLHHRKIHATILWEGCTVVAGHVGSGAEPILELWFSVLSYHCLGATAHRCIYKVYFF